ncbi:uncharacterized protein LOC18427549 [Amborella trichopoda]|uniref:Insecticidal crystal toxin domain-containing protein n=1 Tax=Amborella trichopoda TaxID=13333 RepID=W1NXU7_AMBTC|nr:uncharacterized protein LOC18427549 [Amborella trichopoda]ERM99514.1 hypothetical protein AMTR_s00088p00051370 [Amborella trichopoda]|eukprot:XP_006836661.1 uncharacterized protein LOC18427549 [Amborella trichopoda]
MYVTKPLSLFRQAGTGRADGNTLFDPPPEGPFSGYLVLQDIDEDSDMDACCWSCETDIRLKSTPFPQNKQIIVKFTERQGGGKHSHTYTYRDPAYFIPALGEPLSSDLYYVVKAKGKNSGLVCTCSREEDKTLFLFVNDKKPMPFNHNNIYQRMHVYTKKKNDKRFRAKSLAPDGYPPQFLRRKEWKAYISESKALNLEEAHGMDASLRAEVPPFEFPISQKGSYPIVLGHWYCPSIFIEERGGLEKPVDKMKQSMYYRVSLEQQWEEIYCCEGFGREEVGVDRCVRKEEALLNGKEGVQERRANEGGIVWFEARERMGLEGGLVGVGLNEVVMEKMRWDQAIVEREGDGKEVSVRKVFKSESEGIWKFGLYVLVERYVLRRLNGSLVFTYAFRRPHQLREKWESQ